MRENLGFITELLIWCFVIASIVTCIGTCVERQEKAEQEIIEEQQIFEQK